MAAAFPLVLFPFCLIAAALSDIRGFIIPNELSVLLIGGFAVAAVLTGMPMADLQNCILTALTMLVVGLGLYYLNDVFGRMIFGAGDAKLLTAIALWFGSPAFLIALVYITFAGGILTLGILFALFMTRIFPRLSLLSPRIAQFSTLTRKDLKAPYGVAIAIGALFAFNKSPLFDALVASLN